MEHVEQKGLIIIEWEKNVPADLNTSHIYSVYPEEAEYGIWDCVAKNGASINYILSKAEWIRNILIYEWTLDCICGHSKCNNSKNLTPRSYLKARDPEILRNPAYTMKHYPKQWL